MAKNSYVKVVLDNTPKFLESLEELVTKSVFVGIPSTAPLREPLPGEPSSPPNNAVIGYVMENGDPEHNIPARPFLVPGVKGVQPEIIARLKEISKCAMNSDISKVRSLRIQLGLFTQRAVQEKITEGPFAPLSEVTLEARARRKFGKGAAGSRRGAKIELARRAAGFSAGTDFARPLIDTGQLRRSINFVVGPNRNRKKTIRAMMEGEWPVFTSPGK